MLTPAEYTAIPDQALEVLSDLEAQIVADAARRIKKAGEMTNSAEWQIVRLQELGMSAEQVRAAIAKAAGLTRKEIDTIYTEAAKRSSRFDNEIMQKMGLPPVDPAESPTVQQFIRAAKAQTGADLDNITGSMGFATKDGRFKPLQTAYLDAMNYTQYQVASGAMTADDAVRQSIKLLADSGLRVVDYASGVRNHIEVAARRAILTGVGQVVGQISEANAAAMGTDYVEVTAHAGARPDHAAWQGKVYRLTGSEPGYPNLAETTGYGTVTGLKGANCRHDFFPFVPGISQRAYTDEQLKSIDPAPITYEGQQYTFYEATQKQRQIETAIRQSKRRCIGYDAAGLKDDYTTESVRLQRLRTLYADFSKQAGLVTQNQRTQVAGWGKSSAGRSRVAAQTVTPQSLPKENVVHDAKRGIIQAETQPDVTATFRETLTKQPGMTDEYAALLERRFESGGDAAKAAYVKYVPTGSVKDPSSSGTAHYSPSIGGINMDLGADLENPRGPGTTWFHEHGHLVDHTAGGEVYLTKAHPEFQAAIEDDWRAYRSEYKKAHGLQTLSEVYDAIGEEIEGHENNSISDIIGGLTNNRCVGWYSHREGYWKARPDGIGLEAFAHFFEAQFKPEKWERIKRYFPTATAEFEKLLGGIL